MERLIETRVQQFTDPAQRVGATYVPGQGVHIRLWAPAAGRVEIEWEGRGRFDLGRDEDGYHTGFFPFAEPGDRYVFHAGKRKFPDPASRYQPDDVYGSSAVVASDYPWTDGDWVGVPYEQWVIYEIHTGTYSVSHDFDGIAADLPRLRELGVTTLEIMPVSQFSGTRNWGYDGVFPHAVQHSYGGPERLKALVDACHAHGMAIILDVVFNHIGPEGNALFACGPYAQSKYRTPWGDALNFDGPDSDHVRRYFLQAAWQWLTEFRFDGLRLDAVQTIFDTAPTPFLEELARLKKRAEVVRGQSLTLIAETDMNDPRLLAPPGMYGFGMDGQWADDLHHALHATLTGENSGYYADYGGVAQIARIYREGVAYAGDYSPFRRRRHGRSYEGIDKRKLVVETQNHDQVGNRAFGERLSALVDASKLKLAAAAILLSPFTPFLFMGEEWGETKPFLYFVSHHDEKLREAVRKGRREEWTSFGWTKDPPDPAAPDTFDQCVLTDKGAALGQDAAQMEAYYRVLITLSKKLRGQAVTVELTEADRLILLHYTGERERTLVALCFSEQAVSWAPPGGEWELLLRSAEGEMGDIALQPWSASVFRREGP